MVKIGVVVRDGMPRIRPTYAIKAITTDRQVNETTVGRDIVSTVIFGIRGLN